MLGRHEVTDQAGAQRGQGHKRSLVPLPKGVTTHSDPQPLGVSGTRREAASRQSRGAAGCGGKAGGTGPGLGAYPWPAPRHSTEERAWKGPCSPLHRGRESLWPKIQLRAAAAGATSQPGPEVLPDPAVLLAGQCGQAPFPLCPLPQDSEGPDSQPCSLPAVASVAEWPILPRPLLGTKNLKQGGPPAVWLCRDPPKGL